MNHLGTLTYRDVEDLCWEWVPSLGFEIDYPAQESHKLPWFVKDVFPVGAFATALQNSLYADIVPMHAGQWSEEAFVRLLQSPAAVSLPSNLIFGQANANLLLNSKPQWFTPAIRQRAHSQVTARIDRGALPSWQPYTRYHFDGTLSLRNKENEGYIYQVMNILPVSGAETQAGIRQRDVVRAGRHWIKTIAMGDAGVLREEVGTPVTGSGEPRQNEEHSPVQGRFYWETPRADRHGSTGRIRTLSLLGLMAREGVETLEHDEGSFPSILLAAQQQGKMPARLKKTWKEWIEKDILARLCAGYGLSTAQHFFVEDEQNQFVHFSAWMPERLMPTAVGEVFPMVPIIIPQSVLDICRWIWGSRYEENMSRLVASARSFWLEIGNLPEISYDFRGAAFGMRNRLLSFKF